MRYQFQFLNALLKRLIIMICLFTIIRVVFFLAFNRYFEFVGTGDFLHIILGGIRFDISAVLTINVLVIIFYLLPFRFRIHKYYQKFLSTLFIVFNSIALLMNLVDFEYFSVYQRRLDFGTLTTSIGNIDSASSGYFLSHYWFILVLFVIAVIIVVKTNRKIKISKITPVKSIRYYPVQVLIFIIALGLTFIGMRGGLQYKPLDIINAGLYTSSKNTSMVTGNPFVLIRTASDSNLGIKWDQELKTSAGSFNPVTEYHYKDSEFTNENVVIIILESFSKEFIGALNPAYRSNTAYRSYAPFLDSLISNSLVCMDVYANDENSIRSLPNILSAIPSWLSDDFTLSVYAQNEIESIASILKKKGYQTSFFHGGRNGTMNFDSYVKSVGFDDYYGLNEFPDKLAYDGKWGIFDDEFLQFFADKLDKTSEPFVAGFFSLSSHDPYKVPEKFSGRFNTGKLLIHNVAAYSDYALQEFFRTASQMPWYENTIFVITADHSPRYIEQYMPFYKTLPGRYSIPIIFFRPDNSLASIVSGSVQQTDILPTVLDLLKYNGKVFGFGKSILDSARTYMALNRLSNNKYFMVRDSIMVVIRNDSLKQVYNIYNDSMLQNNLVDELNTDTLQFNEYLRAIVTEYTNCLIENRMTPERYAEGIKDE